MGLVIFGLAFVQALLGIISYFTFDENKQGPSAVSVIHHWIGRIVALAAVAEMFLGIWTLASLYGLPSMAPYGLMAGLVASNLAFYLFIRFKAMGQNASSSSGDIEMRNLNERAAGGRVAAQQDEKTATIALGVGGVLALLLFAGFVVTIFVPAFTYGSAAGTASGLSLNQPSKGCFRMNNYSVPPALTTYVCRGFRFPNSPAQQALLFEPQVDQASVVHHMVLYRTTSYIGDASVLCPSMPAGSTPLWAWALGSTGLAAPPNTGFLAGTNFALQMHYNNPSGATTIRDSSGVKISFTPNFRQTTSFFMQLGVTTDRISLPPKTITHLSATCNIGNLIPAGAAGIVWTNGLHGHTRARMIWIEHIRGSSTIGYIGCNPFYDFNRQTFEMRNATVIRGDSLKIHCQFDTSDETTVVTGGEETTNEMCLAFLGFYPQGMTVTSDLNCYGPPVKETPITAPAGLCT